MKIVVAFNNHRHGGGADVVAQATVDLLSSHPDVHVIPFIRDSRELKGFSGRIRASVSGCYSAEAVRNFSALLETEKPDVVHAQELYPLISPWIFKLCKEKKIPVVMTCHDYRMSCPIATHFRDGSLCHECPQHSELRCILHNCCGSMAKSTSYAARNYLGRKKRLFLDFVDIFLVASNSAKEILCRHSGVSTDRVVVTAYPITKFSGRTKNFVLGDYVAYAGRFEPEKGFDLLVKAMADTGLPLKVAGNAEAYLASHPEVPEHVEFAGLLSHDRMGSFYQHARMLVVPSIWHETFGLVVAEALSCGTPAVVSNYGALAEVAGPGGVVFSAGDVESIRAAVHALWHDAKRCEQLARDGGDHVSQYSDTAYLNHLLSAYEQVLQKR